MRVKKYRYKPHVLLSYEALFRRLKENYRENQVINNDYANYLSGYIGEQQVDYKLSIVPHKGFHYFQDLRLKINSNYFQIDSLIISNKFILIIEIKNWKGEIRHDPVSNQIIHYYNNTEKVYNNPLMQVMSHEIQFNYWLQQILGIYDVPIESLVVVSNPNTIIKGENNSSNFYQKLIHIDQLIPKVEEIKNKYVRSSLTQEKITSIQEAIIRCNIHAQVDLIKFYNLDPNHFIKGIQCKYCDYYPLQKLKKKWYCMECKTVDPTAHKRVILDYFLLIKPSITNRELREYLHVQSPKTSYNLLQSMNLEYTGKNKGRIYHTPSLDKFPQNSFTSIRKKHIPGL